MRGPRNEVRATQAAAEGGEAGGGRAVKGGLWRARALACSCAPKQLCLLPQGMASVLFGCRSWLCCGSPVCAGTQEVCTALDTRDMTHLRLLIHIARSSLEVQPSHPQGDYAAWGTHDI